MKTRAAWRFSGARAALLASLAILSLASRPPPACGAEIWFGPRGPENNGGPADWAALFHDSSEWSALAARIQVYSFTAGYVTRTPDDELRAMADNLRAHGVRLSLSSQSIALEPGDRCGHTEGYAPLAEARAAAEKLARLEIRLDSVVTDEPVALGHDDVGPQGCQFPLGELADRVAATLGEYRSRQPDVAFGDVEPLPGLTRQNDWRATYHGYLAALADRGFKIKFLQTDNAWRTPDIYERIKQLAADARASGLAFGVIYNGDGDDATSAGWVSSAIGHFERLEQHGDFVPDQACFGSWDRWPRSVLPMSEPDTLSHVVAAYARSEPVLSYRVDGARIAGTLADAHAAPLGGVRIALDRIGADPSRPPPDRKLDGVVPANARFAILGLRVNMECNCEGQNDLLLGTFVYVETAGAHAAQRFDVARHAMDRHMTWDGIHVWPVSVGPDALAARVKVAANQHFGFNSDIFPVTPGAAYEFTAPIGAVSNGGIYGYATLIWLDATQAGLERSNIELTRDLEEIGAALTARDGTFSLPLPRARTWSNTILLVDRTGTTRALSVPVR